MLIHFEDQGQDFLTWQLNNQGVVIDSLPFQSSIWCGIKVLEHPRLQLGGIVHFLRPGESSVKTIRYPIRALEADMTPDAFNARYKVGTPCRYYPIAGESTHIKTRTRTLAWALGHGATVVSIEGKTGGVDINHVVIEGAHD